MCPRYIYVMSTSIAVYITHLRNFYHTVDLGIFPCSQDISDRSMAELQLYLRNFRRLIFFGYRQCHKLFGSDRTAFVISILFFCGNSADDRQQDTDTDADRGGQ